MVYSSETRKRYTKLLKTAMEKLAGQFGVVLPNKEK